MDATRPRPKPGPVMYPENRALPVRTQPVKFGAALTAAGATTGASGGAVVVVVGGSNVFVTVSVAIPVFVSPKSTEVPSVPHVTCVSLGVLLTHAYATVVAPPLSVSFTVQFVEIVG